MICAAAGQAIVLHDRKRVYAEGRSSPSILDASAADHAHVNMAEALRRFNLAASDAIQAGSVRL
jgi:hypothetical protein